MPRKIDAVSALAEIKRRRKIAGSGFSYSKLNRYRSSLVSLRLAGASYRDLVFWLRTSHRINTNHTSVMRWMKSLPELAEGRKSNTGVKSNENGAKQKEEKLSISEKAS